MGIIRSRRLAALCSAVGVLLLPVTAHAVNAEHAEWSGEGWSACDYGTSAGWKCYYDVYSQSCPETAVLGTPLTSCHVDMHAVVRVVPILNSSGRPVGCTSVALSPASGGYVSFDSSYQEFDNSAVDNPFIIDVYDVFADGDPGVLRFTALDHGGVQQSYTWIIEGAFPGICARDGFGYTSFAAGTADVFVA